MATENYEIVQLGAPVLRQTAELVSDVRSPNIQRTIIAMQQALLATEGVGLAAPQIGESKRIIIVASRPTKRYPSAPTMEATVMVNPRFQALSIVKEKGWEGCLSIPGIRALVPRYTDIIVQYVDIEGNDQALRMQDFVARVFQHECDHLDGKVYLDQVESNADIIAESEYFKL